MSAKIQELYLYMNGVFVGTLQQKSNGLLNFSYDAAWLAWEYARPISLSMPLSNKIYSGQLVYNFFDNLLPDNRLIRERIQKKFSTKTNNCFDLLYNIGADCVGALQLLNNKSLSNPNTFLKKQLLTTTEIAKLLKDYRTAPLGMQDNSDFRISIAGAQEKTALLNINEKWYLPKENCPTTHILKLPIGVIEHANIDLSNSLENEWLCLQILAKFGLPTARASIHNFNEVKALVVERFDRQWNKDKSKILRLPQEDLCQALGFSSGLKYESDGGPGIKNIMELLQGSANEKLDRYNFMKTIFLFWIMAAIDGHAKNFSLLIEPNGRFKLQPIYDVISAYPLTYSKQLELNKIKMAMGLSGKHKRYRWNEITLRHWSDTAKICKFSNAAMHNIIEEVFDQMLSVLSNVSNNLPKDFPVDIYEAISNHMIMLRNSQLPHIGAIATI